MPENNLFKNKEQAVFALRQLYRKYGYLSYQMEKFEEYDFYIHNKDFLISDRIITFTNSQGKLMALKPDITLSIVKNCKDAPDYTQKVYYNETVYRISHRTHEFQEMVQVGLECIGAIDQYNMIEVLQLAVESLAMISKQFILEISHMGIISALLAEANQAETFNKSVLRCVAEKNTHELKQLCAKHQVNADMCKRLVQFTGLYGDRDTVLKQLQTICITPQTKTAYEELKAISILLQNSPYSEHIQFDFSVVNDMNYYNGIVFKGYIMGIAEGILAGGQYDKLMRKMGKKSKAIGFAVYPDLLLQLPEQQPPFDIDILLLYTPNTNIIGMQQTIQQLISRGKTVCAQKTIPQNLQYQTLLQVDKNGKVVENND